MVVRAIVVPVVVLEPTTQLVHGSLHRGFPAVEVLVELIWKPVRRAHGRVVVAAVCLDERVNDSIAKGKSVLPGGQLPVLAVRAGESVDLKGFGIGDVLHVNTLPCSRVNLQV